MKTIAITLAIAALALLGTAPQAEARSRHSSRVYVSGYRSCGTPIYMERYFIGYDRCGNPVWGQRPVRQSYRPVVRGYGYNPAPCRQPYDPSPYRSCYRGEPYRSGGVVIQGYFGR